MTPNPILPGIKKRLIKGELSQALKDFIAWTEESHSAYKNEVAIQSSMFHLLEEENRRGRLTTDEYRSRLARVSDALFNLIDLCDAPQKETIRKKTMGGHNKYTCDRVEQLKGFGEIQKKIDNQKLYFLYLYGGDMHAHEGCLERIACHLDDRDLDVNRTVDVPNETITKAFTFSSYDDFEEDKKELIKSLFSEFKITVNEQEPILEKHLADVLEKSPELVGKGGADNVCVMITITEDDWDREGSPELVTWFVEKFCKESPSADQPTFYFFFGIEYYDEEDGIVEEIKEVVQSASYVQPLPKLDFVKYKDIRIWFNKKYRKVEGNPNKRRAKMAEHFGESGDFYMIKVQEKLKQIIDEVNNNKLIK